MKMKNKAKPKKTRAIGEETSFTLNFQPASASASASKECIAKKPGSGSGFLHSDDNSGGIDFIIDGVRRREPESFDAFVQLVEGKLGSTAKEKGYSAQGPNGPNQLYEFVLKAAPEHGHALGEIIYKAVRFTRRRDRDDLIKIAAWAFLVWRFTANKQTQAQGRI